MTVLLMRHCEWMKFWNMCYWDKTWTPVHSMIISYLILSALVVGTSSSSWRAFVAAYMQAHNRLPVLINTSLVCLYAFSFCLYAFEGKLGRFLCCPILKFIWLILLDHWRSWGKLILKHLFDELDLLIWLLTNDALILESQLYFKSAPSWSYWLAHWWNSDELNNHI